jgi:hypothetical protein
LLKKNFSNRTSTLLYLLPRRADVSPAIFLFAHGRGACAFILVSHKGFWCFF